MTSPTGTAKTERCVVTLCYEEISILKESALSTHNTLTFFTFSIRVNVEMNFA
jgi:hypothetical protein